MSLALCALLGYKQQKAACKLLWHNINRTLMKPMSLAYSLKHWRQMFRLYLRMMPPWLLHTRLQDAAAAAADNARKHTATAGRAQKQGQAKLGVACICSEPVAADVYWPCLYPACAAQVLTNPVGAVHGNMTMPSRLCLLLHQHCAVVLLVLASSLLLLLQLLQRSRQVLLLLLHVASSCKHQLPGRSPSLL